MKNAKFLVPVVAVAMMMNTGCSKNDLLNPLGCGNGTWVTQVSNELNALTAAAGTYNNDPTAENCQNYISATKNYLDALEGVRSCVAGVSKAEFNEAIAEAQQEIDQGDCNG